MDNKHKIAFTAEEISAMQNDINQFNAKVKPHAITLGPEDRHEMPKVGPKTVKFVQDGCALAEANPQLCPDMMNLEAAKIDLADFTNLLPVKNALLQALDAINDIQMQAGSEAYQSVLTFYSYVKFMADKNVEGAKAIYEQLKSSYPIASRHKAATTPEATA